MKRLCHLFEHLFNMVQWKIGISGLRLFISLCLKLKVTYYGLPLSLPLCTSRLKLNYSLSKTNKFIFNKLE